jgi:hypothetical protein
VFGRPKKPKTKRGTVLGLGLNLVSTVIALVVSVTVIPGKSDALVALLVVLAAFFALSVAKSVVLLFVVTTKWDQVHSSGAGDEVRVSDGY